MRQILRTTEGLCSVCRCVDRGVSVRLGRNSNLWVCSDPECLDLAVRSSAMRQEEFLGIERQAAQRGGEEGGGYLEAIGKTDLADLTPEQWDEFVETVIQGYRVGLKKLVDENAAPF